MMSLSLLDGRFVAGFLYSKAASADQAMGAGVPGKSQIAAGMFPWKYW